MKEHRILILGCSGSGKSTLTKRLAKILDLPVLHLDRIWHKTNYDDEGMRKLKQTQFDFIKGNKGFIIDGNYSSTLDLRVPHATLIIYFQLPRYITLYRVLKRTFKVRLGLEKRTDMAEKFKERVDREYLKFLKFVWKFNETEVPIMEKAFRERDPECRIVAIKNNQDKAQLLEDLKSKQGDNHETFVR